MKKNLYLLFFLLAAFLSLILIKHFRLPVPFSARKTYTIKNFSTVLILLSLILEKNSEDISLILTVYSCVCVIWKIKLGRKFHKYSNGVPRRLRRMYASCRVYSLMAANI